jgi:hypothetical protein
MADFELDDKVPSLSFFKNKKDYELFHPRSIDELKLRNYPKRNADNIPYYILYRLWDTPCEGKVNEERMFSFESYLSHYKQLKEITEQINKTDNLHDNRENIFKFVNNNKFLTSFCNANQDSRTTKYEEAMTTKQEEATTTKYKNEKDFSVDHPQDLTNINLQIKNKDSIPFYLLYSPSEMFFKTFSEYQNNFRYLSYLNNEFIPRLQVQSLVEGHQRAMESCEEKEKDFTKSARSKRSRRSIKNSRRSKRG